MHHSASARQFTLAAEPPLRPGQIDAGGNHASMPDESTVEGTKLVEFTHPQGRPVPEINPHIAGQTAGQIDPRRQVLMLENTRFHSAEDAKGKTDEEKAEIKAARAKMAEELASLVGELELHDGAMWLSLHSRPL